MDFQTQAHNNRLKTMQMAALASAWASHQDLPAINLGTTTSDNTNTNNSSITGNPTLPVSFQSWLNNAQQQSKALSPTYIDPLEDDEAVISRMGSGNSNTFFQSAPSETKPRPSGPRVSTGDENYWSDGSNAGSFGPPTPAGTSLILPSSGAGAHLTPEQQQLQRSLFASMPIPNIVRHDAFEASVSISATPPTMTATAAAAQAAAALKGKRPSILNRMPHDMSKYKTQICNNMVRTGTCEFGDLCIFAHSQAELRDEASNNSILRTFAFPAGVPPPPPPPPGMPPMFAMMPPPPPGMLPLPPMMMPPMFKPKSADGLIVPASAEDVLLNKKSDSVISAAPMVPPFFPPEILALYGLPSNPAGQYEATIEKESLPSPVDHKISSPKPAMGTTTVTAAAGASQPLLPNIYPSFSTDFKIGRKSDVMEMQPSVLEKALEAKKENQDAQHEAEKQKEVGNAVIDNDDDDEKFDSRDFKDLLMIVQGMAEQIIRLQSEVEGLKSFLTDKGIPLPTNNW